MKGFRAYSHKTSRYWTGHFFLEILKFQEAN